jgi:hypothetical protein
MRKLSKITPLCFSVSLFSSVALFCAVILTCSTARAAEWATLTGRIVYDGKVPKPIPIEPTKDQAVCSKHKLFDEGYLIDDKGGVANAVIMLKTKNVAVNPEYEKTATDKVVLDNKNCRFEPHVTVLRTSQTLVVRNSDPAPVSHNTNIAPLINAAINPVLAAGGDPIEQKFEAEEGVPIKVGCNIHPWMGAYLIVRKDPYAAVTDKDGKFTLKDLPAGSELEFVLWEENPGYLKNAKFKGGTTDAKGRFKMKLKPGATDLGDIKVPGSIFKQPTK